ncbi:MAG TPA: hypothetical protein RMH85_16300 [Polyangiaceae bacterium LLY-WYZ-15_(1-7)]|nr:hypothetical protein [Myxococcales bacterium]MAT29785.1 hypothetical protein [Sandaracinus sp.]MBJ75216.1 hypothetical protein [Sandaracinus sp.]HJL10064.1 hypothetical protein [Polyangiaceae bacterium LLY-WYZ-15_(1-7)]
MGSTSESARPATRPGRPYDPRRLATVWREGRGVLLGALLLGIGLGVGAALAYPRQWTAETWLERQPVDGETRAQAEAALGATAQELFLPRVLAEAGRASGLPDRRVADHLFTETHPPDRLEIRATAGDPVLAAGLAHAAAEVLLRRRGVAAEAERRGRIAVAEGHVEDAREAVRAVRAEREAFRREHVLADLSVERVAAIEEAAELRAEAERERIESLALGARAEALAAAVRELPALTRTVRRRDDATLAALRTELAEAEATLADEHPRVLSLRARIRALEEVEPVEHQDVTVQEDGVRGAVALSAAETAAAQQAAEERASSYAALADAAAERISALSALESEASMLAARLELAEGGLESAQRELAEARSVAAGAGYEVVEAARPPDGPDPEKGPWLVGFGLPLGVLLLALLVLALRDLGGLRPRTPAEVAWWGGGPVLGSSAWPEDPRGLDALVAELEDHGAGALGRTLVVPLSEDERELACAFAARLGEAPWLAAGILDVEEDVEEEGDGAGLPRDTLLTPPPPQGQRGGSRGRFDTVFTGPPEMDDPPPDPEEARPTIRLSRATVRAILTPDGGLPRPALPEGEAPDEGARVSFAGLAPVVVAAPTKVVGAPAPKPEPVVVVGRMIPVEGRAPANVPEAVLVAAREVLGEDEDAYAARADASEDALAVALAWNGPLEGPALRRACRLADRVVVVVRCGRPTGVELRALATRLGAPEALGFVLVGAASGEEGPDRAGDPAAFWRHRRFEGAAAPIERPITVKA